ncbi:MAG TPA: hypothetical protein PLM07_00605 [Candidatus Rifleibacterium sp.]|nr:hypothetical protein [Candidatus Rifleibacterium sp.]HPT44380.1 hypothetical protein [Candidatus Rifleibacterium sp.]
MNMLPANPALNPLGAKPAATTNPGAGRQEVTPPKCFGTDYFGKWNTSGMTLEGMKIDHPDYQQKCANCSLFERCYMTNHIRLLRIKK